MATETDIREPYSDFFGESESTEVLLDKLINNEITCFYESNGIPVAAPKMIVGYTPADKNKNDFIVHLLDFTGVEPKKDEDPRITAMMKNGIQFIKFRELISPYGFILEGAE